MSAIAGEQIPSAMTKGSKSVQLAGSPSKIGTEIRARQTEMIDRLSEKTC
jgi:hypothetical protein